MSASTRPTRRPACASATARLAATVDLPTPPFPEETATIFPRLGWSTACGAVGNGPAAPPPGGAWVVLAGPAGLVTLILIWSFWTPSTAATAARAERTRPGGASGGRGNPPLEGFGHTASTCLTSGTISRRRVSIPCLRVTVEAEHPWQVPPRRR